ncbi:G-protein coupled receptor [Xylaria bambusicola]|uniref:G-protein coupled receptor n=1 Tax=Xylaria bambusicola TaxID=326684 RepID=UPI00200868B5|nr:G-protein coupled receptor [Xylaria bambusicola]KAI0515391.1 G-protein coupled receptor [Xylaria bambusicola]
MTFNLFAKESVMFPSQGALRAITIIERIGSVFSLLGCIFIIITFTTSSAFRKPINRLVFYASFGNMAVNVGTLIARSYVEDENSTGCQVQAFLIQQFLPSDALWAFAMAFNVYLTFYFKFDAEKLKRIETWYLLICYGLPFPPALAYIFIHTQEKGRVYGDAILWCWVNSNWDVLRVATFYAPIWVIILATFFIYIRCGSEIYRKRRLLRKADSSSHGGHDFELSKLEEASPPKTTVTTEIRVTSEVASQGSEQTEADLRDAEAKGPGAYSIMISSGCRAPPAPTVVSANPSQSKPKRKKNSNDAAWAYTKCAILFFTALLVTWIPSSANRVFSLVHTGETVVALEILSAIVLPLQGFWNAIIYCVTSWSAVKLFFSEVLHRTRHGDSPSNFVSQQRDRHDLNFSFRGRSNKGSEDSDSMKELAGNAIPMSKSS